MCPVTIEAHQAFDQALTLADYNAVSVGTYNCRLITGGSRLSLHAYGIASDTDPYSLGNPYYGRTHPKAWKFSWNNTKFTRTQVEAVEGIRTNNGKKVFLWGGRWITIKDYMHWEIDVAPSDLATGINWKTVPGGRLEGEEQVLKRGDKGNAVTKFQAGLLGWNPSALPNFGADGDFGGETEEWVKNYQSAADLAVTGTIDGVTGTLLMEYVEDRVGGGISQEEGDARWVRRNVNVTSKFS